MKEQKTKTKPTLVSQVYDLGEGYTMEVEMEVEQEDTPYTQKEIAILNLITAVCEQCPARTKCSEHQCPIFMIEKIITDGK